MSVVEDKTVYRCKKCRHVIFKSYLHGGGECNSYFIDTPSWINVDDMDNEIKFKCPKCDTKIGEIIFSGKKCNCSHWITPAFQVQKNKVDKIVNFWSLTYLFGIFNKKSFQVIIWVLLNSSHEHLFGL